MRLVTWNCNGAFRRKLDMADALEADILVIQECEDPAHSTPAYRDWAGSYAWLGYGKSKGIGIFPRQGQSIEQLNWQAGGFEMFLPVKIADDLQVIAVWTQNASPSSTAYIGQFWHYIQAHRDKFGPRTVIAGDFNSNTIWDKPRRTWNHSTCVDELAAMGFRSMYHLATGEEQGSEAQSTFFLHRSEHKPFHIDYVFAHEAILEDALLSVSVGRYQDWVGSSDHMPIVVDLSLANPR
ncbi:MAG: endonuclease [Novosphingobium sp. 28-62-57]|uniref:endonuclease/exonuclease/phosphatase family protein n=1 Tax=unclassified Novosphingobium TaxID=2644732 RepID=UPI000BD79E86|nr:MULTISPECIES: endonuclease/exonuclease/phosphatase family protein [unclassified Novosphingobium]OYW47553.1 MAG: endonuclease [Novosphingobium sp. 12-63-9]OYZ08784.1 MAG: endonuclease [Novosphingobium sp. 28-62-57]OZA33582.1 MAG: endonuclease [Novosphingobium sp. 17-62-9]HQS70352.1 endonuclease/exonuclease/phosphatase family protein [Novosphingobium sp.]